MPARDYLEQNLATLNTYLNAEKQQRDYEAAKAEGYKQLALQNPALVSPEYTPEGADYQRALKQTLQSISSDPANADPARVRNIILANPLLKAVYGTSEEAVVQTANRIAKKAATGNFDPLIDDDPREQIRASNIAPEDQWKDNPLYRAADYVWEDILKDNFDKLQQSVTGEYLTEKNRAKENILNDVRYLNAAAPEVKSSVAKMQTLKQLEREKNNLEHHLEVAQTREDYNNILDLISINNQKILSVSNSLTDQEKAAYEAQGADYEQAQFDRQQNKQFLENITPRYQSDVNVDMANAQLEYDELVRNGKLNVWTNPTFGARYLLNQLTSKDALIRNASNILPWVALGVCGPLFAIAGGMGLAGSAVGANSEYMDEYFDKHGTLEGYNAGLASLANAVGFIMDLAGGKLLGGVAKNVSRGILRDADKVLKPALEASLATGSNAPLKAGFKTVLSNIRIDKLLEGAGRALKEKALTRADKLIEKGKSGFGVIGRTENILGNALESLGTAERYSGQILKNALVSDASLAFENASATLSRQIAAQNGLDENAIAKAAIEGLASGHLGMAAGVPMGAAARGTDKVLHPENKYLRTRKDEDKFKEALEKLDSEQRYKTALNEVEQFNTNEEKLYKQRVDNLGKKLAKKHENLSYDAVSRTLNPVPGTELTKEEQAAIKHFNKRKDDVKYILDTIGERRDYYQAQSDKALEDLVKEKGVEAYSDKTIRSAFAKKSEEDVSEMLQRIKGINKESADLQAQMLVNKKANVTAKDIGISEDAYNTAELLQNDSTLLTDIKGNKDAQEALGKADFNEFHQALNKQITDNNANIIKEQSSSSPNKDSIKKWEDQNKRLEQLKKDYTQDKWDNKKNVVVGDKETEDYMRKLDKDIVPDRKGLGITDESQLGLTADKIEDELKDIRAKGISKDKFISALMKRHGDDYVDASGKKLTEAETTAYLEKFGKYYDDYAKQLNENIEQYNVHQQYKTFQNKAELEAELKKGRVENAFDIKETKSKTGVKEYYAAQKDYGELSEEKLAKKLKEFADHPSKQMREEKEFNKLLNLERNKEIIKNAAHKTLRKRIATLGGNKGFTAEVFHKLDSADQKTILSALQKAYNRSVEAERVRIQKAIKGWGDASLLRRFTGGEYSNKQKRTEAFLAASMEARAKEMRELNKRDAEIYEAAGAASIDKMNSEQLSKFLVIMLKNLGIYTSDATSWLRELQGRSFADRETFLRNFATNLHRTAKFDQQMSALLKIMNKHLNVTDSNFSSQLREAYRVLSALQTVLQTQATRDDGVDLWYGSTVTSSQKESFATTAANTDLYESFGQNMNRLNSYIRSAPNFNFTDTFTNSQQFEFTDADDLVTDIFDEQKTATDLFAALHQEQVVLHENDVYRDIARNVQNDTDFWQILREWFVTDRDAGNDHFTSVLDNILQIINTDNNTFVREFLVSNVNNLQQAFRETTAENKKNILKGLMRSKLVLAYFMGRTTLANFRRTNPRDVINIPRMNEAAYNTAADTFMNRMGIQNNARTDYFAYELLQMAKNADLIEAADYGNIDLQLKRDRLNAVDTNLQYWTTFEAASKTVIEDLADAFFAGNRDIAYTKPTYEELEQNLIQAGIQDDKAIESIAHNFGHYLYRCILERVNSAIHPSLDIAQQTTLDQILSHATAVRDLTVSMYNARLRVFDPDAVNDQNAKELFIQYRDILKANPSFTLTEETLRNHADNDSTFITREHFNAIYTQAHGYTTSIPTWDSHTWLVVTKALCRIIRDTDTIYTDAISDTAQQIDANLQRDTNHHVRETTLLTRIRERAVHAGLVQAQDISNRALEHVLAYADGWNRLLTTNPFLAENQAIQFAMNMAKASYGRFRTTQYFCSAIEAVNGDFSVPYLNTVAAVTTNFFPRFTPVSSDDFVDKISVKYGAAVGKLFLTEPIMDKRTMVEQVGAQIAHQMGIRKDAPIYKNYCIEAGLHALIMLEQQGLIENVYINTSSATLISKETSGKNKAGTYPVIRLTSAGELTRTQIAEAIKYQVGTESRFIFDDIFKDSETNALNDDQKLFAYDNTSKQDKALERFRAEWSRNHNGQDLFGNASTDINTFLNNWQTQTNPPRIYRAGDYALCILPPRGTGTNNQIDWYVYSKSIKSDNTEMTDERILTLAELMREGRYINVEAVKSTLGFLYNPATRSCIYTEQDLDRIEELCAIREGMTDAERRQRLMLRAAIQWEDPYEENTSIYSAFVHSKNLNNFRLVIQAVNAFAHIQGSSGEINAFTTTDAQIKLRFDEINTVNNRLFVDSIVANYREAKILRGLFDNNTFTDGTFMLNDSTVEHGATSSDLSTTFLHSLGMDADKIPHDGDVTQAFVNLLRNKAFTDLVTYTQRHPNDLGEILERVQAWNTANEQLAENDKANGTNNALYYTVTKAAKHKNVDECITLNLDNPSAIAAWFNFCTQVRINGSANPVNTNTLADIIENNRTVRIDNWTMRCEIDGLTNGPSHKANTVGNKENRDPFSKIMLGSVGINSRFINVFDAQCAGLLDIYLMAGDFAKAEIAEDVVAKFINSKGIPDETLAYISALYGKNPDVTNYITILNDVFDRTMLKTPVMTTNYGAGMAGIIAKMFVEFDKQFSKMAAKQNIEGLRAWFANLTRLTGQTSFTFTRLREFESRPEYITIDSNGNILGDQQTGVTGNNNIFSNPSLLKDITFEHAQNASARTALEPVLQDLYKAIASNLESLNIPYKKATESAQVIAEVFNEVVKAQIKKELPEGTLVDPKQYILIVNNVVNHTLDAMGNIIQIGNENGSTLRTMKDSLTECVNEALSIYVTTKDGQYYSRIKQVTDAKESLGAGNIPMIIHSYDSFVMHQFLRIMLTQHDTTITSIHDAIIARAQDANWSWILNQQHYMSSMYQLGTFGCIAGNLMDAKNRLGSFGLDQDTINRLSNKLQLAQNDMMSETLGLMQQSLAWLRQQLAIPNQTDRVPNNQYSYRENSAYYPSDPDLNEMINGITTAMNNLGRRNTNLAIAKEAVERAIIGQGSLQIRNQYLDKNNHLKTDFTKGIFTVEALQQKVTNRIRSINVDWNNVNNRIDNDPSVKNFTDITDALQSSSTTPTTVSQQDMVDAMNAVQGTPSIQNFVAAAFTAKNYFTKSVIFTGQNSDTEIQQRLTAEVLKWINQGKPLTSWGVLELLRKTTNRNRLSTRDSIAFSTLSRLINTKHCVVPKTLSFNTSQNYVLHVSQDLDYHNLLQHLRSRSTYAHESDVIPYVNNWYETQIKQRIEEEYRGYNGQVVFALTSEMELLELRALQELINTDSLFKNINIVVTPCISNINNINTELFIMQELAQRSTATCKQFVYNTTPTANKSRELLTLGLGTEISESNFTNGNTAEDVPHIYAETNNRNGKKWIDINQFIADTGISCKGIRRRDEWGYSDSVSQAQELTAIDLQTSGIRENSDLHYNFTNVATMDLNEARSAVTSGNYSAHNVDAEGELSASINSNLLGEDSSAVMINTTSDGEVLGTKVRTAYQSNKYFQEAYQKFQYILQTRHEDYRQHKLPDFSSVMMPIKVNVKTKLGTDKVFIFNPSLQTGITRQQLLDSFAEQGNTDVYRDQILRDSPLYQMLSHTYRETRGGIADIRAFILSKANGNPEDIIQIPAKFIDDSYKEELNVSQEMQYKSALGLEKILQDVARAGYTDIITPYSNLSRYSQYEKYLPDITGLHYSFCDFETRNSTYDRELNAGTEKAEQGRIRNFLNRFIKGKAEYRTELNSPSQAQQAIETSDATTTIRGYRGRVDNVVLGTLQQVLQNGQDITATLQDALSEDLNNSLDVSAVQNILPELREVNTMIALYNRDASLMDSFSLVQGEGTLREHNVVSIGSRLVGTTSKAEVIAHEICHTLFRHLGKEPKLLRQTQEIYDYIQRNLTLNDFTDGDTLANRAIMEAVFGEKTPDNIEECLCYYMTNKAFQQAVDNMSIRKNKKDIYAKVQSVFQRVIEFIRSFISGESLDSNIRESMNQIFQECIVLNNKYWENKDYLKQLAADNTESASKAEPVASFKASSSLTEQAVDLQTIKGFATALTARDQSYIDELADTVREVADIQSGFTNDLIASLQGVSPNQMEYLKIRLAGKKKIDKLREEQSATINNLVNKVLKDTSAKVKAKLTTHFVKADISCLFKYNEAKNAYKYLTDSKARAKRIADLEASFSTNPWHRYYKNAAMGLASALVTGFNPTGLGYRNAYEIIARAGSSHQASVYENGSLHNAVDELTSLYAVNLLELKTPNFYKDITEETLAQLSAIHNSIKEAENITIADNQFARLHVPKGELHISNRTHDYRVIDANEYQAYKWAGFKKVSDAILDPYSKAHFAGKNYIMVKGLFKSAVPIEAGCAILTDVFKGRLKGGVNVDDITDEDTDTSDLKAYIDKRIVALNTDNPAMLTTPTSGNLALHFNSRNKLSGANFEINQIDEIKQTNAHIRIGNALGNQYGSILERAGTTEVNTKVAQAVIDIYEKADDKENFEWISETSENEDYRDYYDSVPKVIKDTLTEKYEDRGIPIRKSALNTFFGYKHLSANDTKKFIENERKAQANIDGLASNFKVAVRNLFYNKYVGYGEALARYLAKVGKENILIKGITTSWFNVVSNYILLGLNGLRPDKALAYEIDGINQFLQIRDYNDKLRDLNQKKIMHTYTDADARSEKGIKDALRKLPMYALYEKGLIGDTLAEDLTESDRFVMNTIDKYVSKGPINTLLHNTVMDPQGILYGILSDFAALGDVAGKYALYRYNKEKGMSEEEAQRRSLNAFIDYSNPLPKSLQLLDDIAVLPFMKYSVGIQNVIADALVRHPERSLAWLFANGTFDITNDVFDSLLGLGTLANKLQVPGKMFIDSLKTLPSVRVYDALT